MDGKKKLDEKMTKVLSFKNLKDYFKIEGPKSNKPHI